jgi:hypothetical protein
LTKSVKVHKDEETGEYYIKLRPVLYNTGVKLKDVDSYDLIPASPSQDVEMKS